MTAELRVEHLRMVFAGGRVAVDDVSFLVPPGELVVLLGPSGCGKTTTLRCVAGLERPTAGSIHIGKEIVSSPADGVLVPPRRREIGMVFQSYAVWPHMTVYDNVAYPLRHRRVSRSELDRKVSDTLELVGLSEHAGRPVTLLSGGQMQRVALARSLVYHPRLLLLDEPLSNLDAKLRLRLRDDLRRIIKRSGVTALYVTHDQAEAVALADRIGVMRDGALLQMAPPAELYGQPASLFVAHFTGASSLLTGRLVSRNSVRGTVALASGDRLLATVTDAIAPGESVTIAIRPESVILSDAGGLLEDGTALHARIVDQRYQGVQTLYALEVGAERIEAIELGSRPRFGVGDEIQVILPAEVCWAYRATDRLAAE